MDTNTNSNLRICQVCGKEIPEGALFCPRCGVRVAGNNNSEFGGQNGQYGSETGNFGPNNQQYSGGNAQGNFGGKSYYNSQHVPPSIFTLGYRSHYPNPPFFPPVKSKVAGGVLGILLGAFGAHNFYLGYTNKALLQLLGSTIGGIITCGIATTIISVWALVEGILILTGGIDRDSDGRGLY